MCAMTSPCNAPPRIEPLERAEFLREYGRPMRPCILTEAMKSWAARSWTLESFRTRHGDTRFLVGKNHSRTWAPREMTLRDYLDAILDRSGAPDLYLASAQFLDRLPMLRDDFAFPDYVWQRAASNTLMFIGGAGARTPLHFDHSHTLLAQIVGRKRFRLFSPAQTPRLAPLPRELYQTFGAALINARAEGDAPVPDFDFILEPGEMLFLPFSWWHAVDSLDPTLSITRSWWTFGLALSEAPRVATDSVRTWLRAIVGPKKDSRLEPQT
jgi:ribosomal protein L16 Arg81 hydroxylase